MEKGIREDKERKYTRRDPVLQNADYKPRGKGLKVEEKIYLMKFKIIKLYNIQRHSLLGTTPLSTMVRNAEWQSFLSINLMNTHVHTLHCK